MADIKQQSEMDVGTIDAAAKPVWTKTPPEQVAAVRDALGEVGNANSEKLARQFKHVRAASVAPLLEGLTALGLATKSASGGFPSDAVIWGRQSHRRNTDVIPT